MPRGTTPFNVAVSADEVAPVLLVRVLDMPYKLYGALSFDGVDDYVEVPRVIQDDWTIEFWVNTTDVGLGTSWYLGKGLVDGEVGGLANDFGTSVDSQGRFTFGVGNPDTHLHGSVINDGNWHHCAATRIASTGEMKVYTDGVLDNSVIGPTGTKNAPPSLRIGMLQTGIHPLNGFITEVRIWNFARTAQQIADWKDRTLAGDEPGLVGYWRAQETWKLTPETNTLPDLSGHGNDGNIYGARRYTPTVTAIAPTANYSRDQLTAMGYNSRDDMIAAGLNYRAQPTPDTAQFVEIYDAGTVIASTNIRVTLDQTAVVGSVTPTVTISTRKLLTDPWTDFPAGQNPVFATNFRYVKVKVDYSKDATDNKSFLVLNELETVLSSKIKNDTGVAYVSANPTTVNFNVDFIDVQGITVTPQGTTPLMAVVDFDDVPHPTSFDVYLFNGTTGAPATGQVRWTARGY